MQSNFRITAVGDIMLGEHPVRIGNGVRSHIERYGLEWLFSAVRNQLADGDVVFGNLEVAHSDIGLVVDDLTSIEFRGSPESILSLRNMGFNVLNFANNHCMEHGIEAYFDTIRHLEAANISPLGMRTTDGQAIPLVIERSGFHVAMLAYSLRPEEYYVCGPVPYALSKEEDILQQVAQVKQSSDIIVVSLHWGEEFMDRPSRRQIEFAHKLVDAGAKLILGHHPHVLQGIERYCGAVIAYSLGNFVFDMWQQSTRSTIILKAKFEDSGEIDCEPIPVYINGGFQPIPLRDAKRNSALKNLEGLSHLIDRQAGPGGTDSPQNGCHTDPEERYLREVRRQVLLHRIGNYVYFGLNIYRYKWSLIVQSLKRFIARRNTEISSLISGDVAVRQVEQDHSHAEK